MPDKPYTERTGGRYVRDPATGRRTRAENVKPEPTKPAPAPAKKDETAEAGKGNKS
jgi:hypothetical protein